MTKSLAAMAAACILASCGGGSGGGSAPGALSATLTAPANLASGLTGTLALAATATGSATAVEFEIDGMAVSEDTSSPYTASVDTALHATGQHVIRARARDAAGARSAWSSATVRFDNNVGAPAGFTRTPSWVTGLSSATAFAQVPDGRIFVAEQGGRLRVIKNGTLLAAPFHQFNVDSAGERGLLGIAFHPAFATNGFVYVYYTATTPATHNRISRLAANGDVSTGTETVLQDLPNLSGATNHNGGAIHFGPDGKLYAAVGDNANSARAPDLNEVFGKMLRFNDDGTIPGDNPFCATAGQQRCAIWARGLRNPFTFAFDPASGRMHINDVGEDTWEEIDVGAAGADYGWPGSEGPANIGAGVTAPLFAYRHTDAAPAGSGPGGFFTGQVIAGGAFYPASGPFPAAYRSNYFFADFSGGWIGRLDPANDNAAYAFGLVNGSPLDLLVGADGALYVLTRSGIARFSAP